ncbi:Mcm2-7 hexameric complex component, partial [Dinochytrium kinnereticum]
MSQPSARSGATQTQAINVNYGNEKDKIKNFLQKFTSNEVDVSDSQHGMQKEVLQQKYMKELEAISERKKTNLIISLDDVVANDPNDEIFVQNIECNTARYVTLFSDVVDELLPKNNARPGDDSDPLEVILFQRRERDARREDPTSSHFPAILTRRYHLSFKPRSKQKAMTVRDIKGSAVGRLVTVKGIVTRVSNVKPQVAVMGMSCDKCGYEHFQVVSAHSFTPLPACTSDECKRQGHKGKLFMQTRGSRFLKFQEAKIQELVWNCLVLFLCPIKTLSRAIQSDQVPMGHIPRSMTIHLYEDLTRQVSPGDTVFVSGVFLPTPYVGYKSVMAGLLSDTFLEAHHIVQLKKQYSKLDLTPDLRQQIRKLTETPDLYRFLSQSIAPEIYGHEDIKKALLLLLVGGSSKETADGMKIRGDINICLMGDPGVAKSQLLKYISKIAPRGIYTTGRGSSGVGLTASVMRDPITDEMVLEGGALVLADNGIACIDEFDKMDENDRTAIHEVMEQQTISISKAGITTTLNARTSILAAANPQFGRYNTRLRPTQNINLPAALLSRFDLLFLILDRPDLEDDLRLASHVTHVHIHNAAPLNTNSSFLDINVLRHYISIARSCNPVISAETAGYLVNAYTHMRQKGKLSELQYTCARTLLSMIRLSTALARLRFSDDVDLGDVEEAIRLLEVSKVSVEEKDPNKQEDPSSQIYRIIREMSHEGYEEGGMATELSLEDIRARITMKGFSDEDLEKCLDMYENNNLWMRTRNGTVLSWVYMDMMLRNFMVKENCSVVPRSRGSGMGADIYKEFESAKRVMDECEEALGIQLKKLMFDGPQ